MYYFISQIIINFLLKKIVLNFWSLLEFLLKKNFFILFSSQILRVFYYGTNIFIVYGYSVN